MEVMGTAIVRGALCGLVILSGLGMPAAQAQTTAYLPDAIAGTVVAIAPGNGTPAQANLTAITPASTLDGHTIAINVSVVPKAAVTHSSLTLGNFSSDPGASYFQSLTCTTAEWGTQTLTPSSGTLFRRTYYSTTQSVEYSWTGVYPFFIGVNGSKKPATCTINHSGLSGWIRPKYEVVGLVYAPPGSKSTVNYTSGFQSGTATSTTNTYSSSYTSKVSVSRGFSFAGIFSGTVTTSVANGWGQTQESTNSITVSETYTTGLVQGGPLSSAVGVDHDFDVIYVWLNPEELLGIAGNVIARNGFGWDGRDSETTPCGTGITGMDVVGLTLGQLRGTQAIKPNVQCRLDREWDPVLGALTSTDLLAIADADPFYANPQFNPNTANSPRFELPNGQDLIMNYIPAAPGEQPTGYTYASTYSKTSMLGQTATDTHSTTWSLDANASGGFLAKFTVTLNNSAMYTTTNKNSSTITSGTSQAANFTIYGPAATDNYTGPTAIQVWKDNVYGTFMFFPEN